MRSSKALGFRKREGLFLADKRLSASKGLCNMELYIWKVYNRIFYLVQLKNAIWRPQKSILFDDHN
jgi:hypothetical protein